MQGQKYVIQNRVRIITVILTEKGKELQAGTFGGAGLNTLSKAYMDKYGIPYSRRSEFLQSIDRMMDLVPDVHMGNHLGDNAHHAKLARAGGENNPFVDGSTWKQFLSGRRAEAVALFERDPV